MGLKINIDTAGIAEAFGALKVEVEKDLTQAVGNLAAMTHAKVIELATQELHSSQKTLTDNTSFEEIMPGLWVVSINEKALWIEDGLASGHDMKDDLLKNATKVSKDGHKYRTIPFDYATPSSQLNGYAQGIVSQLKQALKKQNIPFQKIEKDSNGRAKLGKIHTVNIDSQVPGRGNTPVLKGVNIYQSLTKTGNVRRDVMTFRTVSEGPGSEDKWIHPGVEAKKFLDRALAWAETTWESQVLPDILKKWTE